MNFFDRIAMLIVFRLPIKTIGGLQSLDDQDCIFFVDKEGEVLKNEKGEEISYKCDDANTFISFLLGIGLFTGRAVKDSLDTDEINKIQTLREKYSYDTRDKTPQIVILTKQTNT